MLGQIGIGTGRLRSLLSDKNHRLEWRRWADEDRHTHALLKEIMDLEPSYPISDL